MSLEFGEVLGIVGIIIAVLTVLFADEIQRSKKKVSKLLFPVKRVDDFNGDDNFWLIDSPTPYYKPKNLTASSSNKSLIIGIPENKREFLEKTNFVQKDKNDRYVYREDTIDKWQQELSETFAFLEIEDYHEVIKTAIETAFEEISATLRGGHRCFNGPMFGVNFFTESKDIDEHNALNIDFYETDYFTHRVFANIFLSNKQKFARLKKDKDVLKRYLTPFLTSFGLSTFLFIHQNHYQGIVIGNRSKHVSVDKHKIHFSMNEAFTPNDVHRMDLSLSFKECLYRGFDEELGLSREILDENLEKFHVIGFFMDLDKFEMGITSVTRLKLDGNLSLGKLKLLNKAARDASLENKDLYYVSLDNLNSFIEVNNTRMSLGARNAMRLLLLKKEYHHLNLLP